MSNWGFCKARTFATSQKANLAHSKICVRSFAKWPGPFIRCLSNPVSICQPLPCLCLTDTVTQKHKNTKIQNTKCKKRKIGALISLFYRQSHHLRCYPCMYVLQLFDLWSLLQMSAICSSSTFAAVWPVEQQQRNRETENKQASKLQIQITNTNIARGTTGPGYCLFNLSYLSS